VVVIGAGPAGMAEILQDENRLRAIMKDGQFHKAPIQ
jgi:hypothetical protein